MRQRKYSTYDLERMEAAKNAATHKVPSGMGGVFSVRLLKDMGDKSLIRMVDKYWKGSQYYLSEYEVPKDKLTAIT